MAVTVGLLITSLVGLVGLSVDVGDWYATRRTMQSAVDAAALGGALELYAGGTSAQATAAATTDAGLNETGFAAGATLTVTPNVSEQTVTATLTKSADLLFSGLFLSSAPTISVTATAGTVHGGSAMCLLITSPTASNVVLISGSSSIQASGCGVVVNSTSATGTSLSGNTFIYSKALCGPGGFSVSGSSEFVPAATACGAVSDPLAGLAIPATGSYSGTGTIASPANCDYVNFQTYGNNYYTYKDSSGTTHTNTSGNGSTAFNMNPGVYCGGITFTATTNVVFKPGIYLLYNGGLNTSGSMVGTGTGVAFYLTGGSGTSSICSTWGVNLTASTNLTVTAPTSGAMAGISIYQDQSEPTGSIPETLSGNSTINFTGVLYFGNQNVTVSGSSENQSAGWTAMVAYTVNYNGYSTLYLNSGYSGSSVPIPSGMALPIVALTQ